MSAINLRRRHAPPCADIQARGHTSHVHAFINGGRDRPRHRTPCCRHAMPLQFSVRNTGIPKDVQEYGCALLPGPTHYGTTLQLLEPASVVDPRPCTTLHGPHVHTELQLASRVVQRRVMGATTLGTSSRPTETNHQACNGNLMVRNAGGLFCIYD